MVLPEYGRGLLAEAGSLDSDLLRPSMQRISWLFALASWVSRMLSPYQVQAPLRMQRPTDRAVHASRFTALSFLPFHFLIQNFLF